MKGERPAPFVLTIDGPAGSGKSTTAREVARRLGFRHLDSGALYRALTVAVRREGIPVERFRELGREDLAELDVQLVPTRFGFRVLVDDSDPGEDLRAPETTRLVPVLATNPFVREKLGELQRSALAFGSLVADGRDMGTVVFPRANLKVFLTASLEERSRRRLRETGAPLDEISVPAEADRIRKRDATDSGRAVAPLRKPEGAIELDTTSISFAEQVSRLVSAASALTAGAAKK